MQHRVASPWQAGAQKAKQRNGDESKGTPAKARVSKGNPEQAPDSFARSLCSLASLAQRTKNSKKQEKTQRAAYNSKKLQQTIKNSNHKKKW